MESGPPTPDRPRDPESPGPDPGPQSPAPPPGPQAPAPPAPGPEAPPPTEAPGTLPKAPPAPETPGSYGGPVPPGGWQQPIGQAPQVFAGAELSGWWRRVGAYLLDSIFTFIVSWVGLGLLFAGSEAIGVILFLVGLVVAFLYFPRHDDARGRAQRPDPWGKQILGIRVVRDDGQTVGFGWAFLREFVVMYLLFQVVGGFFVSASLGSSTSSGRSGTTRTARCTT